jgi:hypothetical protein
MNDDSIHSLENGGDLLAELVDNFVVFLGY